MAGKDSARRLKGDGTLYQRTDGLWVAAIDLGYGPDGKRKRWTGASRTKEGALAKLREARVEHASTGSVTSKTVTVGDWLDEWLRDVAKPNVRPKTYVDYERCVRLHLKPRLGREKIARLTPQHIRRVEQAIAKDKTPATAASAHRCLSVALSAAVADGLIPRNPAEHVAPPRTLVTEREPLSAEQATLLLAKTADDALGSRWAFALLTGARQGEALGLEWDRVDLAKGTADIAWQLQRLPFRHGCAGDCKVKRAGSCPKRELDTPDGFEVRDIDGSGLVLTRPKSEKGTRVIPLAPALVDALKRRRRANIAPGLVWTRDDRRPLDPRQDAVAWDELLKAHGLPDVPLHAARHTTATLLLEQGVDAEVIKQILGHSQIVTTRGYQHVSLELARRAVDELGQSLG